LLSVQFVSSYCLPPQSVRPVGPAGVPQPAGAARQWSPRRPLTVLAYRPVTVYLWSGLAGWGVVDLLDSAGTRAAGPPRVALELLGTWAGVLIAGLLLGWVEDLGTGRRPGLVPPHGPHRVPRPVPRLVPPHGPRPVPRSGPAPGPAPGPALRSRSREGWAVTPHRGALLVAAAVAAVPVLAGCSGATEPAPVTFSVVADYADAGTQDSLPELIAAARAGAINEVSPVMYRLRADGGLDPLDQPPDLVREARGRGARVVPTVRNPVGDVWDGTLVRTQCRVA
jgi:hypothetical protein